MREGIQDVVGDAQSDEAGSSNGKGFVHLHLHSEYSLLDGANRVDKLIARVKELGMNAVAVTDHGNLFGAMTFYWHAKSAGVKPILGCEAYVAPGARTDRTHTGVMDGGYHLVLLAETNEGWRNLVRLASEAYLTGFYYKPRVDKALLEEFGAGLIAISGHLGSELAFHLVEYEKTKDESHYQRALDTARWHARTFSPTNAGPRFFVELQRHVPEQDAINPHLIRLARELDLPLVCDNDSHFLLADDWDAHDTLCCISMGKTKEDEQRLRYPRQLYVKSPAEMRELFADVPEAVDNTEAIAARCNVEIEPQSHAPVVRVRRTRPAAPYDGSSDLTAWFERMCAAYEIEPFEATGVDEASVAALTDECDAALRELCAAGLVWRYGPGVLRDEDDPPASPENPDARTADEKRAIRERLDRELRILADKHISAYFLIVWDFVNWGRQRGVPALARGSGVGTMVGYTLGLSNACPVRYGLLFERFTDPDRAEYPDIDIDLCQDRRADVIQYVRQKYGHVAQIITFGTLKAKAAVRDVGRVMGVPLPEVDRIAKLVPEQLKMTLDIALEQAPDLRRLYDDDPQVRRLIDTARTLEGQARHASVHAAGVIVATRPLHEIVPLYKAPGSDDVVTQWDGPTCEKLGLLKMDFLGLRTLSVVERAKELIRETLSEDAIRAAIGWDGARTGDPLDLDRLTFDDQRVFEVFRRAETTGVFQFESGGMRRLLTEMKPDRLEDLIAANALFRPGPMDLIPDYNKRKHGQEQIPRVHEIVDRLTNETYGVMVYQEQVMQICHELGGVPLREAYGLIKAISKKKQKVIDATRPIFVEGALARGLDKKRGGELFDLILKFAGYGFNKSHSTAYAIIAYQTAYLKTFFPNQYMAAFLTYESGALKVEDWIRYLDDCRRTRLPDGRVGVEVSPPDVNLSKADFSVVFNPDEPRDNAHGHVRFGLRAIKGTGSKAIEAIVAERERAGAYRSLFDFCERMGRATPGAVNKATIEALVCSGSFDAVHGRDKRAAMVSAIESAVAAGASLARDLASGQCALFGGADDAVAVAASDPPLPPAMAWDEAECLSREKGALGFYVSSHPLEQWRDEIERFATTDGARFRGEQAGKRLVLGGVIKSVRNLTTKKNEKMAVVTVEDTLGTVGVVLFPEAYAKAQAAHGSAFAPDGAFFFVGVCDDARGEPQLVADDVIAAADAHARLAAAVELRFDEAALNGSGEAMLREAARVIEATLGANSVSTNGGGANGANGAARSVPLTIVINVSGRRIVLESQHRRIVPTKSALDSLGAAVGAANVRVLGGTPAAPARQENGRNGYARNGAGRR